MRRTNNIGTSGVESIRIGEMLICDLPIAEGARAKQQMPLAEDQERQNKILNILRGYPNQGVAYLSGRIAESEDSINRISDVKLQSAQLISEYTAQITLCKFRDDEIARIDDDDETKPQQIKDLMKRFPPYKVEAMQQQIEQSTEAIARAETVIAAEFNTIAELRELKVLCEQRDLKLRYLGARVSLD